MFSFTNKNVTDIWNSEVDWMIKIFKTADFQETASWSINTRARIRHVVIPLVLQHLFSWFEQAVQAEHMLYTVN